MSKDSELENDFPIKVRGPHDPVPEWALPSEGLLEAMDEVPLFMTSVPQQGIEGNVVLSALQSLIYEGTPVEVAENCIRNAVELLSQFESSQKTTEHADRLKPLHEAWKLLEEAIAHLNSEASMESTCKSLLSNAYSLRGSIQLKKRNMGHAIAEAKKSLSYDEKTLKSHCILVDAYLDLGKYTEAQEALQSALKVFGTMEASLMSRKDRLDLKMEDECKRLRLAQLKKSMEEKENSLFQLALKKRGVTYVSDCDVSLLNIYIPVPLSELPGPIYTSMTDLICWPVLFLYPFSQQSDFIAEFSEETCLADHILHMFGPEQPPAPWDTTGLYRLTLENEARKWRVYYPKIGHGQPFDMIPFDVTKKLRNVMRDISFRVINGVLVFIVLPPSLSSKDMALEKKLSQGFRIVSN